MLFFCPNCFFIFIHAETEAARGRQNLETYVEAMNLNIVLRGMSCLLGGLFSIMENALDVWAPIHMYLKSLWSKKDEKDTENTVRHT